MNGKWRVINVMTDEVVGTYDSDIVARDTHAGQPVVFHWVPPRRKSNKRPNKFPEV